MELILDVALVLIAGLGVAVAIVVMATQHRELTLLRRDALNLRDKVLNNNLGTGALHARYWDNHKAVTGRVERTKQTKQTERTPRRNDDDLVHLESWWYHNGADTCCGLTFGHSGWGKRAQAVRESDEVITCPDCKTYTREGRKALEERDRLPTEEEVRAAFAPPPREQASRPRDAHNA